MNTTTEKEVGYDYPLLKEDTLVSELSEKLRGLTLQMTDIKVMLDDKVEKIRKSCSHSNVTENWEKDPNYRIRHTNGSSEYGQKALVSKTCNDCGHTIERPVGREYKICYRCWSPMKHITTVPGEGSREYVYECKNCKSAVSHT